MYKVPMVAIKPIYSVENIIVGTEYLDAYLYVDKENNPIDDFMSAISEVVDKRRSIILYRQDVRTFADYAGGKEAFREIKTKLRGKYTVLKLKYNPRTQEFCGLKTAFIIHHR